MSQQPLICDHCSDKIAYPIFSPDKQNKFCCKGCMTVHSLLNKYNMQDYYNFLESREKLIKPDLHALNRYNYFDSVDFQKEHLEKDGETCEVYFFLEGIHCIACLWLLEKLPQLDENISASEVNMNNSTIRIRYNRSLRLSELAKLIHRLGYPVKPIKNLDDATRLRDRENKRDLIRIAVTFMCTGNIMLYMTSLYTGADDSEFANYFNLLSFLLFLPIVFYSAIPFYQSALSSLKRKTISIDIPIVIAIILGSMSGFYQVLIKSDVVYFDSLSMLVFLLLSSRYILKRIQQENTGINHLDYAAALTPALKLTPEGKVYDVSARDLTVGDLVLVKSGEIFPTDGLVFEGVSAVNNSIITGESKPIQVSKNSYVHAGAVNNANQLKVKVTKTYHDSRYAEILKETKISWNQKLKITETAEKLAKYLVSTMISIAAITFIILLNIGFELDDAFNRAFAIIVITCPCAFGLTTPLTFSLLLKNLAQKGIFIKNANIIEKINLVKNIIFDKTGTLTYGQFNVINQVNTDLEKDTILYHLESRSSHPIAKSMVRFIEYKFNELDQVIPFLHVDTIVEIPGIGVKAKINGIDYQVKRNEQSKHTSVALFKEEEELCFYELNDKVKNEAKDVISYFKDKKIQTILLSGDSPEIVKRTANELELDKYFSHQSPEEKAKIITQKEYPIMVGDGLNDAISLAKAFVGVAIEGGADLSLKASDIYIANGKISKLITLFDASAKAIKLIKANLIFSVSYNLVGVILAIQGHINPLTAAILMPISSLIVTLTTFWGTRIINSKK